MLEAVLSIETPPEWKRQLIAKYHARIDIIDCQPLGERGGKALVSIFLDERHTRMAIDDIEQNPHVQMADLDEVEKGLIKGAVEIERCIACCRMVEPDAFLVESSLERDGRTLWRIVSLDKESITKTIYDLECQDCIVELRRLGTLDPKQLMTSRQEEVLQIAFERGYFDYPKGTSLRDLAAMLDVSVSTLSEMLRKGQRRILEEYFYVVETRPPMPKD